MSTRKFSDAMNELDARYVEEAVSYDPKAKGKLRFSRRWPVILIAAGLSVVLIGCVAVVASGFGTRLISIFTSEKTNGSNVEESGYDLAVNIERIPVNQLSEEINQTGETIKQQIADYNPLSSWAPEYWKTSFTTRKEAYEFVGYQGLKQQELGLNEQETSVNVIGDQEGKISSVWIESYYTADDLRAQVFSYIYTENYTEEISYGGRTTESVEFKESFYTTPNHITCQIIDASALESGYLMMDGYIVDNGVLYDLHIAYKEKDSEKAQDLLHRWADQF